MGLLCLLVTVFTLLHFSFYSQIVFHPMITVTQKLYGFCGLFANDHNFSETGMFSCSPRRKNSAMCV